LCTRRWGARKSLVSAYLVGFEQTLIFGKCIQIVFGLNRLADAEQLKLVSGLFSARSTFATCFRVAIGVKSSAHSLKKLALVEWNSERVMCLLCQFGDPRIGVTKKIKLFCFDQQLRRRSYKKYLMLLLLWVQFVVSGVNWLRLNCGTFLQLNLLRIMELNCKVTQFSDLGYRTLIGKVIGGMSSNLKPEISGFDAAIFVLVSLSLVI